MKSKNIKEILGPTWNLFVKNGELREGANFDDIIKNIDSRCGIGGINDIGVSQLYDLFFDEIKKVRDNG